MTMNRRTFSTSAAVTGAVTSVGLASSSTQAPSANNKVRLGFIGLGNRGDQVLDAFLVHADCDVLAICDIYAPYVEFACEKVAKTGRAKPAGMDDYRKLLERNDLDAVVIATPDHWHALQMIEACRAGKDVYVEKPLGLCVAEGRKMVQVAHETKRIVQVGIQRFSSDFLPEAANVIQSGKLGKITAVRAFHVQNEWPKGIGKPADGEPPAGFDWERWVGPAPMRPYNLNRAFYRFRWFYDYSGGQVTNFGVHYLSTIHWLLGVDRPMEVTAIGGKYADFDNREVPDTLEVLWAYPNNTLVTFSQYNASAALAAAKSCEIEFRGTKGTLYIKSNGYEIVPEQVTPNEFAARTPINRSLERGWRVGQKTHVAPTQKSGHMETSAHTRNFLDCVRSRTQPNCDLEKAHRATTTCQIANIALRLKQHLLWDGEKERFSNCDPANEMLSYQYRKPYQLT